MGAGARRAGAPKQSYSIYRIYKKAQIIKNLSVTALCKVYKVSPAWTTHKLIDFYKGIWGISHPLLAVVD